MGMLKRIHLKQKINPLEQNQENPEGEGGGGAKDPPRKPKHSQQGVKIGQLNEKIEIK